jgi:molecular chaperone GrpE
VNKKHKEDQPSAEKPPVQSSEMETLKNQLLRALADFDNFRKRATLEKEEIAKYSNETLIKELLIILDGFDKAMGFMKTADKEDLIKGIALIRKQLEDTLSKFGVSEVEAMNKKYDPHLHEAILMKESEKENGTIIEVMQKGYVLNGRLIRPSMVIVSKGNT